jgi:prephenate dehydrogenase
MSFVEAMPYQNKDVLIQRIKEAEEKQAAQLKMLQQTDPEGFAKALEKGLAGGRKR